MTHQQKLRTSARAAKLRGADSAGVELAAFLAGLLDEAEAQPLDFDKAAEAVAAGRQYLTLAARLEIAKIIAPKYLAVLRDLGLTPNGRGASPANAVPTAGTAAGASAEAKAHERHRARFSERSGS